VRPRVLAEVEAEILSAMLDYEDRREGLGQDFYNRVASTVAAIGRNPERYPLYEGAASSGQTAQARRWFHKSVLI